MSVGEYGDVSIFSKLDLAVSPLTNEHRILKTHASRSKVNRKEIIFDLGVLICKAVLSGFV